MKTENLTFAEVRNLLSLGLCTSFAYRQAYPWQYSIADETLSNALCSKRAIKDYIDCNRTILGLRRFRVFL